MRNQLMFSGILLLHNIPNREKAKSVEYFELADSSINNFKSNIVELFKSNEWDISTVRFQKSTSNKLFSFDEMKNEEFIFTTVKAFWFVNT